jgi:hypothetical protein
VRSAVGTSRATTSDTAASRDASGAASTPAGEDPHAERIETNIQQAPRRAFIHQIVTQMLRAGPR